ncbi:RDD family protein [Pseudonocardia sp. KRD291]|uniref:RDD family protein n=1 Tax=Pseudonocardia sp. KRD291 TaxID=2792007 RepID=UPI001C4A6382|nr:RDD family protein [Pseudonocardia sp. KRD291]MBW0101604.1 RDD family protein [Pseudonocardia sp. KRD291]
MVVVEDSLASRPEAGTDTRVSGRRVFQLLLDTALAGLLVYVVWAVLDGLGPTGVFRFVRAGDQDVLRIPHLSAEGGGWASVLDAAIAPLVLILVFVIVPARTGRTPMMVLFGLRVLHTDGTRVSAYQHLVRNLLLFLDTLGGGLVGLLIMVFSRHRQRIGDHVTATMVVRDVRGLTPTGS